MNANQIARPRPPWSPHMVLLIAILLPGMGQVLNNTPMRGLMMILFMVVLGLITNQLAGAQVSVIGHLAGGLFVYAVSVMDAYYWARVRAALFHQA